MTRTAAEAAQLSPVPEWLSEHYQKVDGNDFDYLAAHFADDIEVTFANRPTARGKQAVGATLADFHKPFQNTTHHFKNVWSDGTRTLIAFDVNYRLNDGTEVAIESFTILEREQERIKRMRVYLDEGPLRAHGREAGR
jgi:ketosteroid isomerase-like protein